MKQGVAGDTGPMAGGRRARFAQSVLGGVEGACCQAVSGQGAVEAGQGLVVVEAMKMQNEMRSPRQGVLRVLVAEGAAVNAGDVLAIVE